MHRPWDPLSAHIGKLVSADPILSEVLIRDPSALSKLRLAYGYSVQGSCGERIFRTPKFDHRLLRSRALTQI